MNVPTRSPSSDGDDHAWHGVGRRLLQATVTVGVASLAGKVVMTGRDLLLADRFGTAADLDAFLIALALPLFVVGVVTASVSSAMVPAYVQAREADGSDGAKRVLGSAQGGAGVLLAAVAILMLAATPVATRVLGAGFDDRQADLARQLYLLLVPCVLLAGMSSVWFAVLQADERFRRAGIIALVNPLVPLLVLGVGGHGISVRSLAVATVGGYAVEAAVVAAAVHRIGASAAPRWSRLDPDVRVMARQLVPLLAGSAILGSSLLVDQAMATFLDRGDVAVLAFGSKVVSFVLGVAGIALGTAVFPTFTRLVAAGEVDRLQHLHRAASRAIAVVAIPTTLVLALASKPIVELLFHRGEFGGADVSAVAWAQAMLILQVPAYLLGIVTVRVISALQSNEVLFRGAILSLMVNVGLNLALMGPLGVTGIALSTSIVYIVSWLYLSRRLHTLLEARRG